MRPFESKHTLTRSSTLSMAWLIEPGFVHDDVYHAQPAMHAGSACNMVISFQCQNETSCIASMQNVTPRHRDRNPIALAFCKARLQSWSLTVWSSGKAWKLLLVWTNPLLTLIPLLGPAFKPNGCLHRKFASLSCRVSCRPAGMVALALDPPATITWAELPTGYL